MPGVYTFCFLRNLHKINHSHALVSRLDLNFSVSFKGNIWNIVALPAKKLLLFEERDEYKRQVRFSAWQYEQKQFLWNDMTFDESWWVGLLAANGPAMLVQEYDDSGKPGHKKLWAIDIETQKIMWSREYFSVTALQERVITGFSGSDDPEVVFLDLLTGKQIEAPQNKAVASEELPLRPLQYLEGTPYFGTVYDFLMKQSGVKATGAFEYLEYNKMIFISYNIQEANGLANYLLVVDEEGNTRLLEKLDEALKGLGVDTFFILSGCLFFVRNKRELLSYQIIV